MSWKHTFFAIGALLASTAAAAAQTNEICDDLRGRMADLPETIGSNSKLREYRSAIAEQGSEILKVENDLEDNECSSGSMVIINGDDDGTCERIEHTLRRMQQNLDDLIAKRNQLQSGGDSTDGERKQLASALTANGCDEAGTDGGDTIISNRPPPLDPRPYPGPSGVTTLDRSGGPSDEARPPVSSGQSYAFGQSYAGSNVRTVCVRTCDGGFFPMTPNASASDFPRDGATCAKMCPGVKTELFFHQLPNQETSAMISASSGAPYSAMPYAFTYRKRPPNEKSSCTCNLPAYYEEMRRENAMSRQPEPAAPGSITTIGPKAAPPAAAPAPSKSDAPPVDRPYDPATDKARQVGPAFLSTDQRKLDLERPASLGPQPQQ